MRTAGVASLALISAVVLAACTSGPSTDDGSASSAASPTSGPTSAPSGTEAVPDYSPDLSSAQAHLLVDRTIKDLLAKNDNPDGRTVIDSLVAAGFSKKAMELTPDTTSIGRTVDSIEFSVLWKGKVCLLGQVGTAGFSGGIAPVLSTGKCLVGTTRAIDW